MKRSLFLSPANKVSSNYRNTITTIPSENIRNYTSPDFHGSHNYRQSLNVPCKSKQTLNSAVSDHIISGLQMKSHLKQRDTLINVKTTLSELQNKISIMNKKLKTCKSIIFKQQQDQQTSMVIQKQDKLSPLLENKNKEANNNNFLTRAKSLDQFTTFSKEQGYYLVHMPEVRNRTNFRAIQHLTLSIKAQKDYSRIQSLSFAEIQLRKVNLARSILDRSKKTLVIDIDDTLIHCSDSALFPYDIMVPIKANCSTTQVYITIRPYTISFLKRISKMYEIIAFTTMHKADADAAIDEIDPNHQYFKHRLYRKNCIQISKNTFSKDLRVINRELAKMVLVDSSPISYIFQPQNGIPILSFIRGEDNQLRKLEKYLQELNRCEDVRQMNKKTFKLHQYCRYNDPEDLVRQLYLHQF